MTVQQFVAALNRGAGNTRPQVEVGITNESSGVLSFGKIRMGSVLFDATDGTVRSVVLERHATMELMRLIARVHPEVPVK